MFYIHNQNTKTNLLLALVLEPWLEPTTFWIMTIHTHLKSKTGKKEMVRQILNNCGVKR